MEKLEGWKNGCLRTKDMFPGFKNLSLYKRFISSFRRRIFKRMERTRKAVILAELAELEEPVEP